VSDTAAEGIVRCLESAGIGAVFGIPGLYNMPLFEALRARSSIRVVAVRHEQGAAFMADGYARASGREAACLLLPGCGVTNAMTGLSEAYADSSPVLILATQVAREFIDQNRGLLHELTGQLGIVGAVSKHSARIERPGQVREVMRTSLRALRSGRPRPVQIEIPVDVQEEPLDWPEEVPFELPSVERAVPSLEEVEAAVEALAGCSRPLIYAGGGCISGDARDVLVAVAEQLGAPVVTTGMGAGAIPADHDLACGVAWDVSADLAPLVAASDLLLAVGTRFNQSMTRSWTLPLPPVTIRIDVDEDEIRRNLTFGHLLLGDAKATLGLLRDGLTAKGVDCRGAVDSRLADALAVYRDEHVRRVGSTTPWLAAMRGSIPRDGIISADMTVFWADMLGSFPVYEPRTMLFPWGMGTLGFALPAAIGAKLAAPDRPVVAIAGDGGVLFTATELATAVQEKLAIPLVVVNNQGYGMIKKQQVKRYGEGVAVDLDAPDFVTFAEAFGAGGERVNTPEQLADALERALAAAGPTVIEMPWGYEFAA